MGYALWHGADRPSPDHANARFILLISAHLESGHYFNPHAQRVMEAKGAGAKLIVFDTRLSNTASMADYWLPSWPGSEAALLLAMALVINGFGEETGWRGFALPGWRERHGELSASLLIAVPWALWHIPTFFLDSGYRGFSPLMIPGFWTAKAATSASTTTRMIKDSGSSGCVTMHERPVASRMSL